MRRNLIKLKPLPSIRDGVTLRQTRVAGQAVLLTSRCITQVPHIEPKRTAQAKLLESRLQQLDPADSLPHRTRCNPTSQTAVVTIRYLSDTDTLASPICHGDEGRLQCVPERFESGPASLESEH